MRKPYKQTLQCQDGFTLVEIIVTLVILSLVLTVAGTTYLYGVRMYTQTEVKNTEKYVGDNVYKYMQQKITYATKLEVRPDRSDDKSYQKYMANIKDNARVGDSGTGYLYFGDYDQDTQENVLGEKIYGSYTIKYQVTLPEATKEEDENTAVENLLDLTVMVYDQQGQEVYQTKGRIKNLNCNLTVKGDRGRTYTNPLIVYNDTAKQEIDPAMAIANQLRTDYINLYTCIVESSTVDQIEAKYPGWKELTKDLSDYFKTNPNNDNILKYLFQYKYHSEWPKFPQPQDNKLEKYPEVKNFYYPTVTKSLYMRPYCGVMSTTDAALAGKNTFVFVSPNNAATGWADVYFIIDCQSGTMYASTKVSSGKIAGNAFMVNQEWVKTLEKLKGTGWKIFE